MVEPPKGEYEAYSSVMFPHAWIHNECGAVVVGWRDHQDWHKRIIYKRISDYVLVAFASMMLAILAALLTILIGANNG
jgi:hypothetical protein